MTSFDSGMGLGLRAHQSAVDNLHRANMAAQAAEQQRLENRRRAELDAKTAAQVALENQRRAELDAQAVAQQQWENQRIGRLDTGREQQQGLDNRRQARLDTREARQLALENRRLANRDTLTTAQTLWEMQRGNQRDARDDEMHGWRRDEVARMQADRAREASVWEALGQGGLGAQVASRGLAAVPGEINAASVAANGLQRTGAQPGDASPRLQALQQQVELARQLRDPQAYAKATQALAEAQTGGPQMKPSYDPKKLIEMFTTPQVDETTGEVKQVYDHEGAQAFRDWWGMSGIRDMEAAAVEFNQVRSREKTARRSAERLLREQAAQRDENITSQLAELDRQTAREFDRYGPAQPARQPRTMFHVFDEELRNRRSKILKALGMDK